MPDIDMDFCQARRREVIDYVMRKYGADHVAQIVTFGTMAARAAIRDVGRAMNFTYAETDVVAKLIPGDAAHDAGRGTAQVSPKLRELYDGDERVQKLVDTARAIGGDAPQHLDPRRWRRHHRSGRCTTMSRWPGTTRPSSPNLP